MAAKTNKQESKGATVTKIASVKKGEIAHSPTMRIPMSALIVDHSFNKRSRSMYDVPTGKDGEKVKIETYRGVPELAAEIKSTGQLSPVIAIPTDPRDGKTLPPGTFFLVAGFRRYEAIKYLGADWIEAKIESGDAKRAALLNIKENVARDQFTTYDLARACVSLKNDHGMTQDAVAKELSAGTDYKGEGMSRSYVGNLIRCMEGLDKMINEAWRDGHPAATTDFLISLARLDKADQIDKWTAKLGVLSDADDAADEAGEGGDKTKSKKMRRATESVLADAIRAVESDLKLGKMESVKDAYLAALRFAQGKNKKLLLDTYVVFDPKAKKEESKKESKKE